MGALWDYSSCTGRVYPIAQVVLAVVIPGLCVCELLFLGALAAWVVPGSAVWRLMGVSGGPSTDGDLPACLWLTTQVSTAS